MDVASCSYRSPERYDLFGLVAESHVRLPLPRSGEQRHVEILNGRVKAEGDVLHESGAPAGFSCRKSGEAVLLQWENARFYVTRDRVVIDADDDETAAHLLVPAVWSVVLAAHRRESLHGAAVTRHDRGVAILGQSGSGKSTAAWQMIERGWQLVSDDLLTFDASMRVLPGPPWLRFLSSEDGDLQGIPDAGGKLRVSSSVSSNPVPLCAIVIMEPQSPACARLTGTSAISALLHQLYYPVVTHDCQVRRRFELVHTLAENVPIFAVPPRSLSPGQIEDIVEGQKQ